MGVTIKENLLKMKLQGMENTFGEMENHIKVNGEIAKWMVKESLNGLMENDMKENIKMIKSMDLEYFNGKMVVNMKDNG